MLYEITPDPSITGGTWYSEHEFEASSTNKFVYVKC